MGKMDGFDKDRLHPGNPREVAFARAWKKVNDSQYRYDLGCIVENLIPDATSRDGRVAATVIQWLGSNVGISFLKDVIEKNKSIREYINS